MLFAGRESDSDEENNETFSNNDSCLKHSKALTTETMVEIFVVSPIILFIVVSNAFVLVLFVRERRLHKKRYWFIASLALADLFIGLFIMPFTLTYKSMNYWPLGVTLCEIWLATDVWLCTTSTLTICAIGIDRYMTLARPLLYTHSAANWRVLGQILCKFETCSCF